MKHFACALYRLCPWTVYSRTSGWAKDCNHPMGSVDVIHVDCVAKGILQAEKHMRVECGGIAAGGVYNLSRGQPYSVSPSR